MLQVDIVFIGLCFNSNMIKTVPFDLLRDRVRTSMIHSFKKRGLSVSRELIDELVMEICMDIESDEALNSAWHALYKKQDEIV